MLTLPGDVPLVTEEEIAVVLDAHGGAHGAAPALSIVPARDGRGSNCMALTPAGVIPFHFGDDSFLLHLEEARRCGIEVRILELPGLGLDIDTPADLRELLRRPGAGAVHAYLETSDIAARLESYETFVAPSLAVEVSA
jgi:2-phospho-L-lactate guanylyltransferase